VQKSGITQSSGGTERSGVIDWSDRLCVFIHYGGLQTMGTQEQKNYMIGTTQNTIIETDANQKKLSAPANTSCSEHGMETLYLFGESLKTIADNKELTAPFSVTKANTNRQSLSDRLTPLLISAGLVRGIIPMSMRAKSNQGTLDIVLKSQDGDNVE
jgi:hypothetical protein